MDEIYNFIVLQGIVTVDAGAVLQAVANEYKTAFGNDLVVPDSLNIEGASTPQGVLIVTEALARLATANAVATFSNQINPNLAQGVFLDAILALSGLERRAATHSLVTATLTGAAGTTIPANSRASVAGTGSVFESVAPATIASDGFVYDVLFRSVEAGAIGAPAGDLNKIESNVLGWDSITNPDNAVLGQSEMSDVEARQYRNQTLALQGASTAEAIIAGVSAVQGVKSMAFLENSSASPATIENVDLVAHSIYAVVDGGTDLQVAEALVSKKSAGAAYNNTSGQSKGIPVSQNVIIPFSGQVQTVLFDRPAPINILAHVTVKVITPVTNPILAVQDALTQYANGEIDGLRGLVVGQNVSSFELAGAIATVYPGLYVQQVLISEKPTTPVSSDEIPIEIYQIARFEDAVNDITVTIL